MRQDRYGHAVLAGLHPLLRSHYAGSHTGVCLHFRVAGGSVFGLARGVDYSKPRPPILIPMRYNGSEVRSDHVRIICHGLSE
jgi:hypothetical protein